MAVVVGRGAAQPAPLRISIQEAMVAAVRTSLPLAAARATRERAGSQIRSARSGYFPQITVTGSYVDTLRSEYDELFAAPIGTGQGSGSAAPAAAPSPAGGLSELPFAASHAWRAGVDVTQSIWDGGRTGAAIDMARGAERSAELDEIARRAQAVLDVTDAYFGAALAGDVAAIDEASLAAAEQTLAQARLGFAQGTAPEFDVVRAEVTRDNQRTTLVRSRAARDVALVRLRRLLGLPFDRPIELTTRPGGGDLGELARGIAGVPRGGERVGVAQARANVAIRRAQVASARAARWPRLSAFTSYGVVDYPREVWPDEHWRTNWTAGVNVSLPLFTGLATTAEIASAEADQRAAEALASEAAQLAEADQRERSSDVAVAQVAYAASHHSAELARRAAQIAEVRYRQGVSTYLELVDARISLDQAQINEATAARDLEIARVRLAILPALPVPGGSAAPSTTPPRAVTPRPTLPAAPAGAAGPAAPGVSGAAQTPTGTP